MPEYNVQLFLIPRSCEIYFYAVPVIYGYTTENKRKSNSINLEKNELS